MNWALPTNSDHSVLTYRRKLAASLCLIASLVGAARTSLGASATSPAPLKPGDILYADSGNAIDGGFIIKVDPVTGEKTVLSSGGYLQMPFDLLIDANGEITVSDSGRLIRISPATGQQTVLADNSQGALGFAAGIDLDGGGNIVAANLQALVLVDSASGQIQTLSSGDNFLYPVGVAVAENGDLYVANIAFPSEILRVNPRNGNQKVISRGGFLKFPQGIALRESNLYVTDIAGVDGNFGIGRVIRINVHTGKQAVVAEGENLVGPVGIAVDAAGQLIVGDPYTKDTASTDPYPGAIIRIDPVSRVQAPITRGQEGIVNPRGVAIVPGPAANSNRR